MTLDQEPESHIATVQDESGDYSVVVPHWEYDYFQSHLKRTGQPHELGMLQALALRLAPGDLVLDVGSNIGNHALYWAIVGKCNVVAYEPNVALTSAIEESVRLNGLDDRLVVRQSAVGSAASRGRIADGKPQSGGSQRVALDENGEFEVVRLDDESFDQHVSLIRIDVEGMEIDALRGAEQLIAKDRPALCVECHDQESFETVAAWMVEHEYGFRATYNATTTHLFVPAVSAERDANLASLELIRSTYRDRVRIDKLRSSGEQSAERPGCLVNHWSKLRADVGIEAALLSSRAAYERVREEALTYRAERDRNARRVRGLKRQLDAKHDANQHLSSQLQTIRSSRTMRLSRLMSRLFLRVTPLRSRASDQASVPTESDAEPAPRAATAQPFPPAFSTETIAERTEVATSAGQRLRHAMTEPRQLRVAAIVGDMSARALTPECSLLVLSRANWSVELESFSPDMLWVESLPQHERSAWRDATDAAQAPLAEVLEWCRHRGIATAFWDKEVPHLGTTLVRVAVGFDHVFTGDTDQLGNYRLHLGHDRVHWLPHAVQPRIHNPLASGTRETAMALVEGYHRSRAQGFADLSPILVGASGVVPVDIFDLHLGTTHQELQFPTEYQDFIAGTLPPDQTAVADKGYSFGLALAFAKQSSGTIPARVLELLAQGTVTFSSFSRGIQVCLGDLVHTSDDPSEFERQLRTHLGDPVYTDRLAVLGLRKVLSEHTWEERLRYVTASLTSNESTTPRVTITVVQFIESLGACEEALARCLGQHAVTVHPVIVSANPDVHDWCRIHHIAVHSPTDLGGLTLTDLMSEESLGITKMDIGDWYGEHYLQDMSSAWKYSDVAAVGKSDRFEMDAGVVHRVRGPAFSPATGLPLKRSLLRRAHAPAVPAELLRGDEGLPSRISQLAIHRFDYCANVGVDDADHRPSLAEASSDLSISLGLGLEAVRSRVLRLPNHATNEPGLILDGESMPAHVPKKYTDSMKIDRLGNSVRIWSRLESDKPVLILSSRRIVVDQMWANGTAHVSVASTGDLEVHLELRFLDSEGLNIGSTMVLANTIRPVDIPPAATHAVVGWRIRGAGSSTVGPIHLTRRQIEPGSMVGPEDVLVVANGYPTYDDLYPNAFVHARVQLYRRSGLRPLVFKRSLGTAATFSEFEGASVLAGRARELRAILDDGNFGTIITHFLTPPIWRILQDHASQVSVIIWIHGFEIQLAHRRSFNLETPEQIATAAEASDSRKLFWREVFATAGPNVHFVFVSRFFATQALDDLGVALDSSRYSIIHNPIDTDLFTYTPKEAVARNKILSIRQYTSRIYANDLAVAAVLELSRYPWFEELSFCFIGDGPLFLATVEPLRGFDNVEIHQGHVSHESMANLFREYGVLLIPSRSDTHGVTRDEGMSAGMVPVSSAVAAVPEFLSESEGFLAPFDSHLELTQAIVSLHDDPQMFLRMSAAAAARVRRQAGAAMTIPQEIALIRRGDAAPGSRET